METNLVAGVESDADSDRMNPGDDAHGMQLRMLGRLAVHRQGANVPFPASRKVRALAAYLALATRPVSRTHLCELLWDTPNDPRGELRWCLSKLRSVLDEPAHQRVQTSGDLIRLDLSDCLVDAIEVTRAAQTGIEKLTSDELRTLTGLFAGDFLDGLELERSPHFNNWLTGQRRRFRACHTAVLEQRVRALPADSEEVFGLLEKWLELASLDPRAHEFLLSALASRGRMREGAEHLAAATRLFEAEGLDAAPIREAWRAARRRVHRPSTPVVATSAGGAIELATAALGSGAFELDAATPRRASIAVMPLIDLTAQRTDPAGLAGGLAHDIITRLAKLRSVVVIAQGTVFALSERSMGAEEAGRTLNVDYVATGSVRRQGGRITVMMELAETRMARIVWAEDFDYKLDDALLALDEMGNRIVASLAGEIENAERNRARLKPPSSLDAWEAYHRGLWHMYRFNSGDNELAQHFLQMAVRLDPTFSRAHAGLSFTHFQNAFLHRTADRELEVDKAIAAAGQSLIVDDRDPAAHWAMGRALWLRGRQDECLAELDQAVTLSPNFALGHYTLAFVHSQSGDARTAIECSDYSRRLSPFDPLLFAMMASRALAHLRLGEFDEAARWSLNAAARPNAHVHIRGIAGQCLAAAGRLDEARAITALIHKTLPRYSVEDFLAAFQLTPEIEAQCRQRAPQIGLG